MRTLFKKMIPVACALLAPAHSQAGEDQLVLQEALALPALYQHWSKTSETCGELEVATYDDRQGVTVVTISRQESPLAAIVTRFDSDPLSTVEAIEVYGRFGDHWQVQSSAESDQFELASAHTFITRAVMDATDERSVDALWRCGAPG